MRAKNVPAEYLKGLAERLGIVANIGTQKGSFINFTLRLDAEKKYQSYSPNPMEIMWSNPPQGIGWKWRKTNAVCFHGHFDFIELLFEDYPDAVIESGRYGHVKYTAEDFVEKAGEYGNRRLGNERNIYWPIKRRDCCWCEHNLIDG